MAHLNQIEIEPSVSPIVKANTICGGIKGKVFDTYVIPVEQDGVKLMSAMPTIKLFAGKFLIYFIHGESGSVSTVADDGTYRLLNTFVICDTVIVTLPLPLSSVPVTLVTQSSSVESPTLTTTSFLMLSADKFVSKTPFTVCVPVRNR